MSESRRKDAAQNGAAHSTSIAPHVARPNVGNRVTVVLGAQWGDEGKGKVVDLLAQDADIVCRCQVNYRATLPSEWAKRMLANKLAEGHVIVNNVANII